MMRATGWTSASSRIPWQRPRAELLLLLLIAAVTLSSVAGYDRAGQLADLPFASAGRGPAEQRRMLRVHDRSVRSWQGHLYSDKAPGMSVIEIAPAEAVRLSSPVVWTHKADLRLWVVHLFASGIPFLLCVFLVGRISEGIAPGYGAPAMVAFGLGTLFAPLAASGFDHVLTACVAFLAFVLAWRRRPLAAGLGRRGGGHDRVRGRSDLVDRDGLHRTPGQTGDCFATR